MSKDNPIREDEVDSIVGDLLKLHNELVQVDIQEFLDLLKHSLSLNTIEKKKVLDAVPTLSQFQFDELTKVFKEERIKFKELANAHPGDIKKLLAKQQSEWLQLGEIYQMEMKNQQRQELDANKIDSIKADLGL